MIVLLRGWMPVLCIETSGNAAMLGVPPDLSPSLCARAGAREGYPCPTCPGGYLGADTLSIIFYMYPRPIFPGHHIEGFS